MKVSVWPRSVRALCWALAAMHWRYGTGPATYVGLQRMLGIATLEGVRQMVRKAQTSKVVVVKYVQHKPVVALRADALRALEKECFK